jgi:hypothetical protein
MEQTTFKKPSVILSELLAEQPEIELAEEEYYNGHGCYCALGHIAKARGYSDEDFLRKGVSNILPEFFLERNDDGARAWYPNLMHTAVTQINDSRYSYDDDKSKLEAIIEMLQEKGL